MTNEARTTVVMLGAAIFFCACLVGCTHIQLSRAGTAARTKTVTYTIKDAQGVEVRKKFTLVKPATPRSEILGRIARPRNLPATAVWRPRRHFGPFYEGSDFSRTQVQLNTSFQYPNPTHDVNWYFNNFFSTVDNDARAIYRIYYRTDFSQSPAGVVLPTDATPARPTAVLAHTPGAGGPPAYPGTYAGPWSHDVLMSLRRISYSSRYGGSLLLHFTLADIGTPNNSITNPETFAYEFGKDAYKFDVSDLSMDVYVTPQASDMNPLTNAVRLKVPVHVELLVQNFTAYLNDAVVAPSTARSVLDEILAELGPQFAHELGNMGYRGPATRFAYAWLHDQHQARIAVNEKVTQLVLADGFSDVWTEATEPYLFVAWRTRDLDGLGFVELQEEWRIGVNVNSVSTSGRARLTQYVIEYEEEEGDAFGPPSAWRSIVGLPVSECETQFNHLEVIASPTELDPIDDDQYKPVREELFLLCSEINAKVAAGPYYAGPVEPYGAMNANTDRSFIDGGIVRSSQDLVQGDEREEDGFISEFRVLLYPR